MSNKSIIAVKEAIGNKERYYGNKDVYVRVNHKYILYKNVYVSINYSVVGMKMVVQILWEDDEQQVSYKKLNLHGMYNTRDQDFSFCNNSLVWKDGNNIISIDFD